VATATSGTIQNNGAIGPAGNVTLTGNSIDTNNTIAGANIYLTSTGGTMQIDNAVTTGGTLRVITDSLTVTSGVDSVRGGDVEIGTFSLADLSLGDSGAGLLINAATLSAFDATNSVTVGVGGTVTTHVRGNAQIDENLILTAGSLVSLQGDLTVTGFGNNLTFAQDVTMASASFLQTNNGDVTSTKSFNTNGQTLNINTNNGITNQRIGGDVYFPTITGEGEVTIVGGDVYLPYLSLGLIDVFYTQSANMTGTVDNIAAWATVHSDDVIMPTMSLDHHINGCTKEGCSATSNIFNDLNTSMNLSTDPGKEAKKVVDTGEGSITAPKFGGEDSNIEIVSPGGDDQINIPKDPPQQGTTSENPIFYSGDPLLEDIEDPNYENENDASVDELIAASDQIGDRVIKDLILEILGLLEEAEDENMLSNEVPTRPYHTTTVLVPGLVTYSPDQMQAACDPALANGCFENQEDMPGFASFQF